MVFFFLGDDVLVFLTKWHYLNNKIKKIKKPTLFQTKIKKNPWSWHYLFSPEFDQVPQPSSKANRTWDRLQFNGSTHQAGQGWYLYQLSHFHKITPRTSKKNSTRQRKQGHTLSNQNSKEWRAKGTVQQLQKLTQIRINNSHLHFAARVTLIEA
jgi:hypothetical protein